MSQHQGKSIKAAKRHWVKPMFQRIEAGSAEQNVTGASDGPGLS